MANFGPTSGWDRLPVWGTPSNFNSFTCWLRYCSNVAKRRPIKLCMMFGRLLRWYTLYTFSGAFAPWQNFARCKIHFMSKSCVILYWQRYCTALQQRASAIICGWYKEWNYGTFAEGVTYIQLGGHHVGHRRTFSVAIVEQGGYRYKLLWVFYLLSCDSVICFWAVFLKVVHLFFLWNLGKGSVLVQGTVIYILLTFKCPCGGGPKIKGSASCFW